MKNRMLKYLPYVNQQTVTAIYIVMILAAMALAGGAPVATGGTGV